MKMEQIIHFIAAIAYILKKLIFLIMVIQQQTQEIFKVAKELVFQEVDIIIIVPSWNDSGDYM